MAAAAIAMSAPPVLARLRSSRSLETFELPFFGHLFTT